MSLLFKKSAEVLHSFKPAGRMLALAESCTGGLIAKSITDHPGSSAVFERGYVTYSNQAKTQILDVPATMIDKHGAVSRPVAEAMAMGALKHSSADIVASVTGIAGPGGGTTEKPVGLIYIGIKKRGKDPVIHQLNLSGDRDKIRTQTAIFVCQELVETI